MRFTLAPSAAVLVLAALLFAGCSKSDQTDGISSTNVRFPNGTGVTVEIMRTTPQILRGMMFRDSLAEDHGMLFVHPSEDHYAYWMYQTRIPLDIVWLDNNQRIVEMSPNTPPENDPLILSVSGLPTSSR